MTIEGGTARRGLVSRAINILVTPKTEWDVIDVEPATAQGLFTGYTMILALIPAIASLLSGLMATSMLDGVGGIMGIDIDVALSPVWFLLEAVKNYVLSLVGVFVTALIIEALAPSFDATKSRIQALKVSTYAATAFWVSAAFLIIPILGALVCLAGAVYACYLIYLGLRQVMHSPESKAIGYAVASIVVAVLVTLVISLIVNIPFAIAKGVTSGIFGGVLGDRSAVTVKLPDGTRVNVDEARTAIEKVAKDIEVTAADGQVSINTGATTDSAALQTLLPASLPGGYNRTEISSGGMAGVASGAEAIYQKGDSRIELNVVDSGSLGALAGMASNVQSNRTTANGYEKMGQVNGRLTTEEYDRSNNSGKYGVMVGNRFMVEAHGTGVTIAELKAAVEAVPFARLEAMSKG